jgi:phosphocarrier protein
MIRRELQIINRLGLHARAAAKLVTLAAEFGSDIRVSNGRREVNGKSIMGVMMLAAGKGSTLLLIADGEDEAVAVAAIEGLVADYFGEGE